MLGSSRNTRSFIFCIQNVKWCIRFNNTCTEVGVIQRLAWSLNQDDMQSCEVFRIKKKKMVKWCKPVGECISPSLTKLSAFTLFNCIFGHFYKNRKIAYMQTYIKYLSTA